MVARANLIELYTNTGVLRKALSLADRTTTQAEEAAFPQGIALGKGWRARVLLLLGRGEGEQQGPGARRHAPDQRHEPVGFSDFVVG